MNKRGSSLKLLKFYQPSTQDPYLVVPTLKKGPVHNKCKKQRRFIEDQTLDPELKLMLKEPASKVPYINDYIHSMDIAAMQSLGFNRFCQTMVSLQKKQRLLFSRSVVQRPGNGDKEHLSKEGSAERSPESQNTRLLFGPRRSLPTFQPKSEKPAVRIRPAPSKSTSVIHCLVENLQSENEHLRSTIRQAEAGRRSRKALCNLKLI